MITYKQIDISSDEYQAERSIRNVFLLRPIGIPDYGWEMHDKESYHFVALDGDEVIGCVVLYPIPDKPGVAQLMQMAVVDSYRGRGIGRGLVECLVSFARSQSITEILCHSRENVVEFYQRLRFECFGEPFVEVGISHRNMRCFLS